MLWEKSGQQQILPGNKEHTLHGYTHIYTKSKHAIIVPIVISLTDLCFFWAKDRLISWR